MKKISLSKILGVLMFSVFIMIGCNNNTSISSSGIIEPPEPISYEYLSEIEATILPDKMNYNPGELVDLTGLVVEATFELVQDNEVINTYKEEVNNYETSIIEGDIINSNVLEISYTSERITKTTTIDLEINLFDLELYNIVNYLSNNLNFSIAQVESEMKLELEWSNLTFADKIETLDIKVYNGEYLDYSETFDYNEGEGVISAYYGFNDIEISANFVSNFPFNKYKLPLIDNFAVTSDNYNIAPLNATFPVLLFSMESFNFSGNTFVYLEREQTYEYNALPVGISKMPARILFSNDFHTRKAALKSWVNDLYLSNTESIINLYVVDNYSELVITYFAENNIPTSNYNAFLMTDGSGTESIYKSNYGDFENGLEKFNDKYDFITTKYNEALTGTTNVLGPGVQLAQDYSIAMSAMENVYYWVENFDNLINLTIDDNLKNKLIDLKNNGKIIEKKVKNLLETVISEGDLEDFELWFKLKWQDLDGEYQQISDLFNDGKKPLIILGTRTEYEDANYGASRFDYLTEIQNEFGNEHTIFYKGHPSTPTNLGSTKYNEFISLGIVELPAAIPAELFIYLYDISLGGYPSSTYASALDEQTLIVIGPLSWQTDDFKLAFNDDNNNKFSGVNFIYIKDGQLIINDNGL